MNNTIEEAQARITKRVLALPGVNGTALGLERGEPCIKVYVSGDAAALRKRIPTSESGFPIVVEGTGPFKAL